MSKDVSRLLSGENLKFSKSQKRIAEYIENNYDKAAFMTAAKLGLAVGVSESTVVRFATSLGYNGYPDFQKALSELIKTELTSVQKVEMASEKIGGDVLGGIFSHDIDMIRRTVAKVDKTAFSDAVERIDKARKIYVLGVRSAYSLASFIHFYFRLFFKDVCLVDTTSTEEVFETMMDIGAGDVLIAISFPRYSSRTVKAAKFANDRRASVIAITDSDSSPLAMFADDLLVASSMAASFVDSLVAPMSLCNALIAAVGLRKKDEVSKTFERLEKIWDEYGVYEKSGANNGAE